jgi:UDPglucose 6-dehydrogenase
VLGLGKLGLPLALVLAEAGHEVHAWDADPKVRDSLTAKTGPTAPHIDEPDVEALLTSNSLHITPPALLGNLAEVVFVVVPTPSRSGGTFDASLVETALQTLGVAPRRRTRTAVALVSTVSPGTGTHLAALCAKLELRYVYAPVMIALGSVVHDLRHPEFQIIGYDENGGQEARLAARNVADVLRSICRGTFAPRFMNYSSAELAKLASNAFATMKISFANLLARMCEEHGGDVDDVTEVLGMRSFIGPRLLTAGAGYGGPCYPRDTLAFDAAGGAPLGRTVDMLNRDHARWVVGRAIATAVATGSALRTYCVLGRGYKEGSNYRIESFGDAVANRLSDHYCLSAATSKDADVVVIALPLREFELCGHLKPGAVVVDLWRAHPDLADCPVTYLPLGRAGTDRTRETTP